MRRTILFCTAMAVLFCLSGLPMMAQGRGSGGGPGGGGGMGQGPGMGRQPGMDQGQIGQGQMEGRDPGLNQPGMNRGTNTTGPTLQQKTPTQLLQQNTKLSDRLQALLPADEKVQNAASGFKNLGEFVAAVHISHNLNIPFDQLKDKVTNGDSLGKALQELNPSLSHKDIKSQVKKGKEQAKADIKTSHQSS